MHQRVTDRWIEAAEARRVCEWAMAEQPRRPAAAPSLLGQLCELLKIEAAQLRLAVIASARPAG
jgi:hypothetical protein